MMLRVCYWRGCGGDSFDETDHGCTAAAIVRIHAEADGTRLDSRVGHIDTKGTLTS